MHRQLVHALVPRVVRREDGAAREHGRADCDGCRTTQPGRPGRAEPARLALGKLAVAAHVAVLAAGDEVERGLVAHVLDLPHGGGIHAREPARSEHVLRVVVQGDLHAPAVDEVELLLLLVEVAAGGELRRQLDRVHAERGHAELAPHLAEARPLPERIDVRDGVAVALHNLPDLVLVSHVRPDYATLSALRSPPRAQSIVSATSRLTHGERRQHLGRIAREEAAARPPARASRGSPTRPPAPSR